MAVALLAASSSVYLIHRHALYNQLEDVLDDRADLVRRVASDIDDPSRLAEQLEMLGLRATITGPDGATYRTDPVTPRIGRNLPPTQRGQPSDLVTRTMALPTGATIDLGVSRDGVDAALSRLLRLELLTALIALPLTALLLDRFARIALRPLDMLSATADRIAAGELDQRLEPDQPATELGTAAAAFDHMLDQLQSALSAATRSERTTREFLDAAAHQLRTPITAASTAVQTLTHVGSHSDHQHLLDIATAETNRAGRIVARLLRVAQIDQGLQLQPTATELRHLIDDEAERAARRAPHLRIERSYEHTHVALADQAATSEILANLLDNATRYASSRIAISSASTPATATVRLSDDGRGIQPEHRERAFHRFVTLDHQSDTGLGLAIARELARAQGGELIYDDQGFELTLPTHQPPVA